MKKHKRITRIFAVLAVITVLMGSLALPIGAEDAAETTTTELPAYPYLPFDWSAYPSANLLDANTATITTSFSNKNNDYFNIERYNNGIKMTVTKYYEKSWHNAELTIGLTKDFLGKTLTLSIGEVTYSNPTEKSTPTIGIETSSKNNYYTNSLEQTGYNFDARSKKITVTISSDEDYVTYPYLKIYLYASYGGEINIGDVITYENIMLNAGDVAYPFIPYMPYYVQEAYEKGYNFGKTEGYIQGKDEGISEGYNTGYQEGQEEGLEEGLEEGYKNGYDSAISELEEKNKTIFDKATFRFDIVSNMYSWSNVLFTPNKIHSGIYFDNLIPRIQNMLTSVGDPYWDNIDYVRITMSWEEEKTFDYQTLQLYISGDFDVQYGTLTTTNGKSYNLNAVQGASSNNRRKFEPETTSTDPIIVKSISIKVGRPADLLSAFTLYAPDESYNNGYSDGYKTGYNEGETGVTHTLYNDGYKEGYVKGKEEGIKLNENGNWRNLITAVVDIPGTIFQNLFNFEVLGLDMRVAFGSLMTLCVIAIILKYTLFR